MGRFSPKYTPAEKAAIARLMNAEHRTANAAVAMAAAGEIPDVEPFTMPTATAYSVARDDRERRDAERRRYLLETGPAAVWRQIQALRG